MLFKMLIPLNAKTSPYIETIINCDNKSLTLFISGASAMNRLRVLHMCLYVLVAICICGGCQKRVKFQTPFPLEESMVIAMLDEAGLPGKISEFETESYFDGHTVYVVRSETESYGDDNIGIMVASVSSAITEDGRALNVDFDRLNVEQFSWEDWESQIAFATLLYGGFDEEDIVYQAFCEKVLPATPPYIWDVILPEGYCRISYRPRSFKEYDEDGFEKKRQSAILRVSIFESFETYQKIDNQ